MDIKVNADKLVDIIEAIKKLPVKGDFDAVDRWVGCVIALQNIIMSAEEVKEAEVTENGE